MNDYWGNLYHQPEVRLVTDEGRSFVRRFQDEVGHDYFGAHDPQRRYCVRRFQPCGKLCIDARRFEDLSRPPDAGWNYFLHQAGISEISLHIPLKHSRDRRCSSMNFWISTY